MPKTMNNDGGKRKGKGKRTRNRTSENQQGGNCGSCMTGGNLNVIDFYGKSKDDIIELKLLKDYVAYESKDHDFDYEMINERFKKRHGGLILVYSPRCPHCVHFKNLYTNVSRALAQSKIPVASINADDVINQNDILTDWLKISGYPSLIWYDGSEYTLYGGERSLNGIVNFACLKSGMCEKQKRDGLNLNFKL